MTLPALLFAVASGGVDAARAAAPPEGVAAAVRAWFDAPDTAPARFEALHAAHPEDDDVAWWLARVRLEEGRADAARALLEGRTGRKVAAWRFAWLRARAWADVDLARARTDAAEAAEGVGDALERGEVLALAAELAWRAGDDAAAARFAREAGGRAGELRAWTWGAAVPGVGVRVESEGRAWWVSPAGLVVPADGPGTGGPAGNVANDAANRDRPVEARGPDLARAGGGPCLATAGVRADLAPGGDGWLYAALDAPEGQGIFTIARCGAPPRRLVEAGTSPSASPATSPAWHGGALLWVEGRAARNEDGPAWSGVEVLRIHAGSPGLLVTTFERGEPRLRYAPDLVTAPVPLFAEDPPISRATWSPAPPGSPAP